MSSIAYVKRLMGIGTQCERILESIKCDPDDHHVKEVQEKVAELASIIKEHEANAPEGIRDKINARLVKKQFTKINKLMALIDAAIEKISLKHLSIAETRQFTPLNELISEFIKEIIIDNFYQILCSKQKGDSCGLHSLKNALIALAIYKGLDLNKIAKIFENKEVYKTIEGIFCSLRGPSETDDATELQLRMAWDAIVKGEQNPFPGAPEPIEWSRKDLTFLRIEKSGLVTADPQTLDFLSETSANLKELSQNKGPCSHVFIIGGQEHWITIVYEKDPDGHSKWYGIDSMDNKQDLFQGAIKGITDAMKNFDAILPRLYYNNFGENLERRSKLIRSDPQLWSDSNKAIFITENGGGDREAILLPNLKDAVRFMKQAGWLDHPRSNPYIGSFIDSIIIILGYYQNERIKDPFIDETLLFLWEPRYSISSGNANESRIAMLELKWQNSKKIKDAQIILEGMSGLKLEYVLDISDVLFTQKDVVDKEKNIFTIIKLINILPLDTAEKIMLTLGSAVRSQNSDQITEIFYYLDILRTVFIKAMSDFGFGIGEKVILDCFNDFNYLNPDEIGVKVTKIMFIKNLFEIFSPGIRAEIYDKLDYRKELHLIRQDANEFLLSRTHLLNECIMQCSSLLHRTSKSYLARFYGKVITSNETVFRLPFDPANPPVETEVDELIRDANFVINKTKKKELKQKNNPYRVFKQHQRHRNDPVSSREIVYVAGKARMYNAGVIGTWVSSKLTHKDLPEGISIETLKSMFEGIRARLTPELEKYILDMNYLEPGINEPLSFLEPLNFKTFYEIKSKDPDQYVLLKFSDEDSPLNCELLAWCARVDGLSPSDREMEFVSFQNTASAELKEYVAAIKFLTYQPQSFQTLFDNFMRDSYIYTLFQLSDEVTPTQYQLFECIKYLSGLETTVETGELLSLQEKKLLQFSLDIKLCPSGKKTGIEAVYRTLENVNKKVMTANSAEEMMKQWITNKENDIFQKMIASVFNDHNFVKELLDLPAETLLNQPSHQIDFLKYRFGKLVGLIGDVEFDLWTHNLYSKIHDITNEKFLEIFYKYFKLGSIIVEYAKVLNHSGILSFAAESEKTEAQKMLYEFFERSRKMAKLSFEDAVIEDDDLNYTVSPKGMAAVLEALGILEQLTRIKDLSRRENNKIMFMPIGESSRARKPMVFPVGFFERFQKAQEKKD